MATYTFTINWATRAGTDEFGLPIVETGSYEVEMEDNNRARAIRRIVDEARSLHGPAWYWNRRGPAPDPKDWHAVVSVQRTDQGQCPEGLASQVWSILPNDEEMAAIERIKERILAKLPGERVGNVRRGVWEPDKSYRNLFNVTDQAVVLESYVETEDALAVAEAIKNAYTLLTPVEIQALYITDFNEWTLKVLRDAAALLLRQEPEIERGP